MTNLLHHLLPALAALAAGITNALAGGGTLITFPTLLAVGLSAVTANVTNTIALCPGFLGGSISQLKDFKGQEQRLWVIIPASVLGGLTGAILLLRSTEKVFTELVPFMILLAATMLALQPTLRGWLERRREVRSARPMPEAWISLPVFVLAIYGGYFGAGMSVILLALFGLLLNDSLTRLNALKQSVALATNVTAALLFAFSGKVVWSIALVMMVGALLGGSLGGRLAGRVKPEVLRWIVVSIGFIVGVLYLIKTYF